MTRQRQSDNSKADVQHFLLPDAAITMWPAWMPASDAALLQATLSASLNWRQEQIRIYGKTVKIPRRQVWMGEPHCSYRYSGVCFNPEPWHPALQRLAAEISAAVAFPFNCVLLNLYANGQDHMGWHADDEPELGDAPVIASLSLGASRRFDLQHRTNGHQLQLQLENGSLMLMAGKCQQHWQHRLPKQSRVSAARLNLTFRYIAAPA
ncbi:alpha-ketoglutarate-dependent dioxygenase AlkB family protein [Arsukibacterium indicum]|uniref:Alpha-ketoglutarate-dependent dioxygenase AlkB n=1 Tax=Arsukibacterium indicum TaxID=2848612 RepID=A0ABS6MPG1_9GAMM|nr:alpha-ketoglutarate-dependent dioxygenase AlkB [Arsukibacterium indicum]MBV2130673.1 alpha-ketoglutarate-dependent dioxygenase AlkB [Arsukibacterium indicum]